MPRILILIAMWTAAASVQADDSLARWRLEGKLDTDATEIPAAKVVGSLKYTADVPGRFIYDPLTGKSAENRSSLAFRPKDKAEARLEAVDLALPTGSFTVEAFVKPDNDPRRTMFAVAKPRKNDQVNDFYLGARFLNQFGQTYWGGGFAPVKAGRTEWMTGPYTTISRLSKETLGWRHLALVHDADRKTMTVYLDHWQAATQSVPAGVTWDDAPLGIGGVAGTGGFVGLIDEVRVSKGALSPAKFLRASDVALNGVSFESEETLLPRGTGYIDVKEGFGAVGDGKHDDTKAFQKAFDDLSDKIPLAYYTLHVPPGRYLLSDTIRCSRFVAIQGAGTDRTTLQLRDKAAGFGDPAKPKVVWRASSTNGPPGSNNAVNGSSIGLYVFDLSIDTGKGNPGAKALEYHSNNHGALENAVLRSGDGAGVVGLDLTHRDCGPSLIKNVRVEGFDVGVHIRHAEYSMTFEGLTLVGQRKIGLLNEGNIVAVRHLSSKNAVLGVVSRGGGSMAVVVDSKFVDGDEKNTAIEAEGGLFARNIDLTGYGTSIRKRVATYKGASKEPFTWEDGPTVKGNIGEFVGDHVVSPRDAADKNSLNLPVEDAPEIPRGDIGRDWVNIRDFADKRAGSDWGPALQAAIDSGAKTVYLPQDGYEIATPVRVHGKLARLFGMRSALRRAKSLDKSDPILIFDEPNASATVAVERLDIDGLEHRSPGTLILRHSTPERFTNAKGAGRLFLEDVMGADWHFDHPQQVWAWQWNPEAHGAGPCVTSNGATVWALGFKTEYESSKLHAMNGAKTEILGGFIYPVNKGIPADRPIFLNRDSSMSLVYGLSLYVAGHDLQVRDEQGGDGKDVRLSATKQVGARFRMDLYISRKK